jgi:hypothetical protein
MKVKSECRKKVFLPFQNSKSSHSYILASTKEEISNAMESGATRRFSAKTDTVSPEIFTSSPIFPLPRVQDEDLIYM